MSNFTSFDQLDSLDLKILNLIQKDFEFVKQPFLEMARKLNVNEEVIITKTKSLIEQGFLTRVGPFFNMDKSSGAVSLVAMKVAEKDFDHVNEIVSGYEEVAHNYKRDHDFNMWFVVAGKNPDDVLRVLAEIESKTNLKTYHFPKLKEYALDLFFEVTQ